MPIYEYACGACGQCAEILQKVSDPPETDCPACGKAALQKLVSAAGFRLNGGGWYETDFKSGSKKNIAGDKSDTGSGASCAPGGCEKPACATKTESSAAAPAAPAAS